MSEPVLHLTDFAPYLNQLFTIQASENETVQAELIEADPLHNTYVLEDRLREPFSLLFKLEAGVELPQRMYDLSCGDRCWSMVFLVPILMPRQGRYLQAVFN